MKFVMPHVVQILSVLIQYVVLQNLQATFWQFLLIAIASIAYAEAAITRQKNIHQG